MEEKNLYRSMKMKKVGSENPNTVPLEEESRKRKTQADVQKMIQDRLKKITEIKHSVDKSKKSNEKEKADSVEVFTALIQSIEISQAELLEVIEEKQKAAERQAEELIKDLEKEITVLNRRDTELEQLLHNEEHLPLLQNSTDLIGETVRTALSQLQQTLNEKLTKKINDKLKETELKRIQYADICQSKTLNNLESKIENDNQYIKLSTGNPSVYLLNLSDTGRGSLNKKDFGYSHNCTRPNKTIMLMGATGSGKSTLINGMINYILGVEWSDTCRFKLIDEQTNKTQAESQTSDVTAYQINYQNGFQVPYSVTIIDTPGFGDTRGIAQDKEIIEKIRIFFSDKDGICTLDAVCFVVQSVLSRLTQTQEYIFEAVLSIFGKDIANNITIMITFADGQKPPVLEAIKAADVPCGKKEDGTLLYFKFNNSALYAQNKDLDNKNNFDEMFWKMCKGNMKQFFTHLRTMETKSLQLTKEVLCERKNLETVVAGVQSLIQICLEQLEEIKTTRAVLEQNQTVIKENEHFEYEIEVPKVKKVYLKATECVTNCHDCNFTCHYLCSCSNDEDKEHCSAIKNGNCTVCPGRCTWNVHHKMPFRFETEIVKEKRTYANLKRQHEMAIGERMTIEKINKQLKNQYRDVQKQTLKFIDELARSLTRLKEIALRPDPLSTPQYIELLIESEKQSAKAGYEKRIAELEEIKKMYFNF